MPIVDPVSVALAAEMREAPFPSSNSPVAVNVTAWSVVTVPAVVVVPSVNVAGGRDGNGPAR